jgi:hypothetical protein
VKRVRGSSATAGRVVVLAWLPMALAGLGASFDEYRALGFTTWRSACRTAGISLPSIATFTLELLPTAVIGALFGGLLVLLVGLGERRAYARGALAAHVGCAAAMPVALLLCASMWPWPLTLAAEAALTALAAASVWWITRIRKATYAHGSGRGVPRIPRLPAVAENFPVNHSWNSHDCN